MSRIVVVSNRVPLPTAGVQAGGLAVVLGGLMAKRGGIWFGWDGNIADDAGQRSVKLANLAGVDYATIALTREEHERYYNGFSNGVLWPLLHTMPELVQFDRRDAVVYHDVNRRMAQDLAPLLRPTDLIWVHDYHMLPMAAALRSQGLRNTIGFFLHIPFPSIDVLSTVPGVPGLVGDMLQADLLGFQTENDLTNFAVAAEALAGAARSQGNLLQLGGHSIRLGVFPVEIEAREFARMARDMAECSGVTGLLDSISGQHLIFGAERLDPTKGLLQRVGGFRRLLETRPEWRRRVTMLQIAATSRKEVDAYQSLRTTLDQDTGALNTDLGEPDWVPLRVVSRAVDRAMVAGYMRKAQVGLVTPLRDGMNLGCQGVCSGTGSGKSRRAGAVEFRWGGAALKTALMVNPRDPEALASAMAAALAMPLEERKARWQSLWAALEGRSPPSGVRRFIDAVTRHSVRVRHRQSIAAESPTSHGDGQHCSKFSVDPSCASWISVRQFANPAIWEQTAASLRQRCVSFK